MSFVNTQDIVDLGGKTLVCANVYVDVTRPDQIAYNTPLGAGVGVLLGPPTSGTGTVTSIGLSLPTSTFTVTNSPVTTTGTITATFNSQGASQFLASPTGASGTPTWRGIAAADLPIFTPVLAGAVPASGGGTSNFARADGSWAVPVAAAGGSNGQVQVNSSGVLSGITNTQLTADINVFTSSLKGAVPASGGGTTNFMRADGTWAVPPGTGGGSGVTSFNTRTGAVVPATGDYAFSNISGNIAVSQMNGGSGASSTTFWRGDGTWATAGGGGGGSGIFFNVKTFGATGNGTTDDTTAIQSAITALNSSGGGVLYFPAGTYLCGGLDIASNTTVLGDGMDASTIVNNGSNSNFETLNIAWTMSGGSYGVNWPTANTTYLINTPTNYSNQVTLTTHSQASNFTVGQWAMVSGGLQGTSFWFPSWWAEVTAVNTSTGVVTLAEEIPFEGALLNTIQVVTAIPQNIQIRNLTLIAGLDSCISAFGMENVLVENCKFLPWPVGGSPAGTASNGLCVLGQAKNSGMRNCISQAYGYELFGANNCFMENCKCYLGQYNNSTPQPGGTLLIDGGSADCVVANNFIIASPTAPATNWIEVENSPVRIKVIGNTITGMPDGCQGISLTDNAQLENGLNVSAPFTDQNNHNIVMGNTILGSGTQTISIGISTTSGVCFGNHIENIALGITATSTADVFMAGNTFSNVTAQGRFSNPDGDLGSNPTYWTTQQSFGTKQMASATATPAVNGAGDYVLSQSGAQSVTNFTGGRVGDEITILVVDTHTTFVHGSGINCAGGANITFATANAVVRFKYMDVFGGNAWYEMSRTVSTAPAGDS